MINLVIYSCQKNLKEAEKLYKHTRHKIPDHCRLFICYGDRKIRDTYESVQQYDPDLEGLLKIDDDVILNYVALKEFLQSPHTANDYMGRACIVDKPYQSRHHFGKVPASSPAAKQSFLVPKGVYAGGPFYYVGRKALKAFHDKGDAINSLFFEDVTVGHHLMNENIPLTPFPFFTDHYGSWSEHIGWHNTSHKHFPKLVMQLQGGLGNQLFQLASLYGLSQKKKQIAYYSDALLKRHPPSHSSNHYISHDFCKMTGFCFIENDDIGPFHAFHEPGTKCLGHCEIKTHPTQSLVLHGYFQHEAYFEDYRNDIVQMFLSCFACPTTDYPRLEDSFFIHFRLGDYVNNPYHYVDLTAYYQKCVEEIQAYEPGPVHFYIFTNDVSYCLQTFAASLLNKIEYTVVKENEKKSLYLMSMCKKGGICANSSFSWWGGYLNTDPNKKIYFPNRWFPHNKIVVEKIGFTGCLLRQI